MLLHPTTVHTDAFTYISADRLFVCEASSLPAPSRIWDDACDTGYTLISTRTNRGIVIAAVNDVRDNEGDLSYTVYAPINRNERNLFTVHIFND